MTDTPKQPAASGALLPAAASPTVSREAMMHAVRSVLDSMDTLDNTKDAYRRRAPHFIDYLLAEGFNRNTLRQYKRFLAEQPNISASTKNAYFYTAKVLLQELAHREQVPDITKNIKGFELGKKHKKEGINAGEVQRISDALQRLPASYQNLRLRAIVALLALQGLRQIEIIRLDRSDVDLVNKTIQVRGKGQHDKEMMYLHPAVVRALATHVEGNRIADGPLFTSFSNNSKHRRLTTYSVRTMVKKLLRELGIPRSTHGFRHYFITALLKSLNGNVVEVAKYSRHQSLEMLQVYNDEISHQETLPRYYDTFKNLGF
jgi:integrase